MNEPQMKQNSNGSKEWSLHGKLHREDGAAIEYADGGKEWWLHSKLHREDGAAIERADGTKMWCLHGKLHREDGAAVEYADGDKMWYLHGEYCKTAEAWAVASLQMQNKPCDAASVDAFLKQILKQNVDESL